MRPRPGSARHAPGHQEALDRRLAMLEAELAGGEADPERPVLRVLPAPPEPTGPPVEDPADRAQPVAAAPPALPVPGRHAAPRGLRSRRWSARSRLPVLDRSRGDAGRWAIGSSQLLVVVLVVAVGIALTAWWVVRSEPVPVPPAGTLAPAAPLVPLPSGAVPSGTQAAPGEPAASPAEASGEVVVHVAGKVRRPGLVVLPTGARVADAVEAAGGPRGGADLTALNLARPLVDGEQVLVGLPLPPGGATGVAPGAPPGSAAGPLAADLVDLNTADQALLETLPGIGPVTATAIIDWRTEHGAFTAVEELLEVDGIGDATLADLAPLVTV